MNAAELVRVGLALADDIEADRLPASAGIIRQLARARMAGPGVPPEDACPRCGALR